MQSHLAIWACKEDRFDIEVRGPRQSNERPISFGDANRVGTNALQVHRQTQQLQVWRSMLSKAGKMGPQLRPHVDDPLTAPAQIHAALGAAMAFTDTIAGGFPEVCGAPMGYVANTPGHIGIRAPTTSTTRALVTGRTIGTGRPTYHVQHRSATPYAFMPSSSRRSDRPQSDDLTPDPLGPTFLEALQDQLGLKLVSATGPADVLVIDHIVILAQADQNQPSNLIWERIK